MQPFAARGVLRIAQARQRGPGGTNTPKFSPKDGLSGRWLADWVDGVRDPMPKLGSLELKGLSGRTYEFAVYPRADLFKPLGAVYFLAKRIPFAEGEAEYTWIYVGESADISKRPFNEAQKPCINQHEANSVCLHLLDDAQARALAVTDLRRTFAPPCNGPEPNP